MEALQRSSSRREALLGFAAASTGLVLPAWAGDDFPDYNARSRGTETPLIPGDYYYVLGQVPPRSIAAPKSDRSKWKLALAKCRPTTTNVPVQQRATAYTTYEPRVSQGLRTSRKHLERF